MEYHKSVLLNEVLDYLRVEPGKKYIDATLGDGGHALGILKKGGKVLGIDYDEELLKRAIERVNTQGFSGKFIGVCGNFKNIEQIAKENGFEDVDGILYDLGFSSFHIDESEKGLSFMKNEPLDMRLDKSLGVSAADLVNTLSAKQLENLFFEYGEERLAKKFALAIVESRKLKKFETTKDITDLIVDQASPGYDKGRIHPATRVFMALRIVVNNELENLKMSLPQAAHLLKLPGGRMVCISFHSLEDRMVKQFGHFVRPTIKLEAVNKKPVTPSNEEIKQNVRARSAKMRVYERINL